MGTSNLQLVNKNASDNLDLPVVSEVGEPLTCGVSTNSRKLVSELNCMTCNWCPQTAGELVGMGKPPTFGVRSIMRVENTEEVFFQGPSQFYIKCKLTDGSYEINRKCSSILHRIVSALQEIQKESSACSQRLHLGNPSSLHPLQRRQSDRKWLNSEKQIRAEISLTYSVSREYV